MNGANVGSVMGVIGLLWCEIVGDLFFSLEMTGGVWDVANFGAGLRFAYSSSGGVLCVWWWRGIVLIPLGRRSDCMNPHRAKVSGKWIDSQRMMSVLM